MEVSDNSCIICAVTVPVLITHEENNSCGENPPKLLLVQPENLPELKSGLQLFGKLLQNSTSNPLVNYRDNDHGEMPISMENISCCDGCWKGLEQLLRLQKALQGIQACLFKQVEDLKSCLLTKSGGWDNKSTLNPLRDQLIARAQNKLKLSPPSSSSQDSPKALAKYQSTLIRPCSVKLTRLSSSNILLGTNQTANQQESLPNSPEIFNPESDDVEDNEDNCGGLELSSETAEEVKQLKKDAPSSHRSRKRKTESNKKNAKVIQKDYFLRLSENLLLFKYTLVAINYGEFLKCLGESTTCNFILNGTDYQSFEEMKEHVKIAHLEESSRSNCPKCGNKTTVKEMLRDHLVSCYGNDYTFICPSCWKPLKSKDGLRRHQWTHKNSEEKSNDERPPSSKRYIKDPNKTYSCDYEGCGKTFSLEQYLKTHQITHLPKNARKKFECPHCPKIFLAAVAVRGHIEREHNKDLMRFRYCPVCNKQFNWRNGNVFRVHVKSHTGENICICEECGKSFVHKDTLRYHMEMCHNKDERGERKVFQCEFCEKRYSHFSGLTRHKQTVHE